MGVIALLMVAIIGAFAVDGGDDQTLAATDPTAFAEEGETAATPEDGTVPGETNGEQQLNPDGTPVLDAAGNPVTGPAGTASAPGAQTGTGTRTGTASTPGVPVNEAGATRTGVSQGEIKWGLHAPQTFDGAPLNLAEDPLEGVEIYIKSLNASGGINGRKIAHRVVDDRYTVTGGKAAANALVNDYKPFFVSGTLGVDQIAQVAAEAKKQKVPYLAAGGSESIFKDIGMFQIAGSYDTHLIKLAEFLGKESKKPAGESIYAGRTKVGVTALDSPYISPSVESFRRALSANGLQLVTVVKVQKPTEQTSYASEINELKKADIVVPAQDPITTSRQVAECRAQLCQFVWSISNFAHESDVALDLMGGSWTGVRGLAGGCYYLPKEGKNPYDPNLCASMHKAHDQWVKINGEEDWVKDGQGGASGYQIVNIWTKALRDIGPDPTREKMFAALLAYDRFSDLVSAPITYRGSSNITHGAEAFVVYEAGSDRKWKQLTPGFVSSF
jgi:branched-chain amino acid transport system substrate-binding protein